MLCGNGKCTCLGVIVSILAGVVLGVLYSLGFVTTGVIFWAYLAIGVAAIFLAPLYSRQATEGETCNTCACKTNRLLTLASIGTIVTGAVGLIVSLVSGVTTISIVLGVATFFAVLVLAGLVCLTNCLCSR
ncbi:MAG: hypothetical protein E7402_01725 [Ruminococcaceae bacterium]|nr:hypothetical protein [Oscillospiraceae bacterium]